jgi:rubrerythrin
MARKETLMEWWKLFSGTFVLIFLAELGDKTQLAAMAKTADSPGSSTAKWVVFLGASLALVASTFIAVFLGQTLRSLVPDERYIKIAAGVLFLVFGGMILREVYCSYRGCGGEAAAPGNEAEPGLVGGIALRAAMEFESHAGERYRRLADVAPPELARLLQSLAKEEEGHLTRLRGFSESTRSKIDSSAPVPELATAGKAAEGRSETLQDLILHEEATADFYQSLANRALIPSVRSAFAHLAEEERGHARRLASMAERVKGWDSGEV